MANAVFHSRLAAARPGPKRRVAGRARGAPRVLLSLLLLTGFGLGAGPRDATADVIPLDQFSVNLGTTQIFNDSFSQNTTLIGGSGTSVPSGVNFLTSPTTGANYFVLGTIPETTANNGQALLSPTNGITIHQPDPFIPVIQVVSGALQSGTTGAHALTVTSAFTVTGLFDLTQPSVVLGTYDIFVTNNTPTTPGNFLQLRLRDCQAGVGGCGALTGPVLQFAWLDFSSNQFTAISTVPLTAAQLANTQLELVLSKADPSSDVITASYLFCNGNTSATCTGTFTLLGNSGLSTDVFTSSSEWVVPGFQAFQPARVPEPVSLLLFGVGGAGLGALAWRRGQRK